MAGLWIGVHHFGVVGAAMAWAMKMIVVDMLALQSILYYRKMVALSVIVKITAMVYISFLVILIGVLVPGVVYKLAFFLIAVSIVYVVAWGLVLADEDKRHIAGFSGLLSTSRGEGG